MNKNVSIEIDINPKDFPDNLTSLIKESLYSKSSVKNSAARSTLAGIGKTAVVLPYKRFDEMNLKNS